MSARTIDGSRRSIEMLIACCAVVSLLFVASCSSDADSSGDGGATTIQSDAQTDDAGGGSDGNAPSSNGDLPDGFPDIPVPEFAKADIIKSETGSSPGWSVMLTVDETLGTPSDEILDGYAAQLEAAGYEIAGDTTDVSIEAKKGDTTITFHSSMNGTITIGVMA